MVSASTGTICATRNMISSVVRKRNLNRVTAVAARKAISAETMTTVPATSRLLRKYRPKSFCSKTRRNESRDGDSVQGRGSVDWISPAGLSARAPSGGVGVAVLDEVRGALGVVEGRLDALRPGVDRYVLDLDLRALVGLPEVGDRRVDDLLLGLVADFLEQPDTQRAGLLVPLGSGAGGLQRAGGGGETRQHKRRGRGGNSDRQLHPGTPTDRRCNIRNVRSVLHNWQESRCAHRRRQVVSTTL